MSMAGVAFGTMSLVIVLSVFNGLEDLIRSLYSTFDPEVKVSVIKGKSFEIDPAFISKIKSVEGVEIVTEVIEDWAHMQYKGDEKLVKVKGVSPNFIEHKRMDSMIVEGEFALKKGDKHYAIVGRGIQAQLLISVYDELGFLTLSYPVKKDSSSSGTKVTDYRTNQKIIKPGAIFAIEKQYDDNYIFVPLSYAEELMDYGNKRTALEIKTKDGYSVNEVRDKIKVILGQEFRVQNSDEQHASLLKAIQVEKLFVHITFSFILAIASLNIFFSLTMLAIEKKKDVAILFSMGASPEFIKKLFLMEGFIIASIGASLGLISGGLICWAQKTFKLVSMGMETSIVDAYPVEMQPLDFIFTGITILIITMAISYRPAVKASKFIVRENLK
jgi:lipoprotein-releasing system permease protein